MSESDDGASPINAFRQFSERQLHALDPVGLVGAFSRVFAKVAQQPATALEPTARFVGGVVQAMAASAARQVGVDADGPLSSAPQDNRFADEAWSANALFYGLQQLYLLGSRFINELVDVADLPEPDAAKARFATGLLLDTMAPTNHLLTNPKALRRAFDTGGKSLAYGVRNYLHDVSTNGGWPSQVAKGAFKVGENLATTKGRVVYRNDLIELIQYEPLTPEVHAVPIIFCPPWINKFYIMDLAPGKSLVEWALQHGLTTFAISYRNPDSSMRNVSFDDYLFQGPRAAIDVVRSITGAEKVNILSVCLGGTLNATLVAYLEANGEDLINCSTYLNTLVDFDDAGTLSEVFTDEQTIAGLEEQMEKTGYLDAGDMAHTFDLLRVNDLVFNYVAANWLMGEDPPAFDLLAWNNDRTRMPAKMHSYYLRKFWIENALALDQLEVGSTPLMVSKTTNDTYLVAAVNDHIVPWRSNYRTTQLFKGARRFVLSSGGHIAGMVNPPHPKSKLWVNDELVPDPDQWLEGATELQDSWWNDWVTWILPRSGEVGPPPPMGNQEYPTRTEAPGDYVRD